MKCCKNCESGRTVCRKTSRCGNYCTDCCPEMGMHIVKKPTIWALKHSDGTWRSPDHYVSSRTPDPKQAKPFYGDGGKHDAGLFQKLDEGSEVVLHPHPELWQP